MIAFHAKMQREDKRGKESRCEKLRGVKGCGLRVKGWAVTLRNEASKTSTIK
jgi:hypothetical protein